MKVFISVMYFRFKIGKMSQQDVDSFKQKMDLWGIAPGDGPVTIILPDGVKYNVWSIVQGVAFSP